MLSVAPITTVYNQGVQKSISTHVKHIKLFGWLATNQTVTTVQLYCTTVLFYPV